MGSFDESVVGFLVLSVLSSVRDDFTGVASGYLDIMMPVCSS